MVMLIILDIWASDQRVWKEEFDREFQVRFLLLIVEGSFDHLRLQLTLLWIGEVPVRI